jgi:TIR domain
MTSALTHPIKVVVDREKPLRANYLNKLTINIALENQDPSVGVVIDSLALRFQSRSKASSVTADPRTMVVHPGGALQIPPTKLNYCTVDVWPNLLFLKYTNVFDIAVSYRLSNSISQLRSFITEGWYVLIEPAPQLFGSVFISYKEPEDRVLAELLFEFTKDAGFDPYMAPPDVKTGSLIWGRKIPSAVKQSKFMFVMWTSNTPSGRGVKKEITIARENGIAVVPLLATGVKDPKLFGRDVEYTQFDINNAALAFAEVVAARRAL